jgi:hypothetical protein
MSPDHWIWVERAEDDSFDLPLDEAVGARDLGMVSFGAWFQGGIDGRASNRFIAQLVFESDILCVATGDFASMGRGKNLTAGDDNGANLGVRPAVFADAFSCFLDRHEREPIVVRCELKSGRRWRLTHRFLPLSVSRFAWNSRAAGVHLYF